MPVYEVESPDGRILELEGASVPSEKELEGIFSQLTNNGRPRSEDPRMHKLQSRQQQWEQFQGTTVGKILSKFQALAPGESVEERVQRKITTRQEQLERGASQFESVIENIGDDAKKTLESVARFAPWVVPAAKGTKLLGSLQKLNPVFKGAKVAKAVKAIAGAGSATGVISGSRFVEELAQGENLESAAREALDAGVSAGAVALALPIATGQVKALAGKLASVSKKSVAKINEVLNGIPAKDYSFALERELQGKSIFKGPFDSQRTFDAIGKRAQKAMLHISREAGSAVGAETKALRGIEQKIDTSRALDKVDDLLNQSSFEGETALKKADIKIIDEIRKKLSANGGQMSPGKMHVIKRKIWNELPSRSFPSQTVSKASTEGQGILKQIGNAVNQELRAVSTGYAAANDRFSKIKNIEDRIRTQLGDKNVARNLKNLYRKDLSTQSLFEEVNELAPKGFKFMDQIRAANARDVFSQIAPGLGGGSGGLQGAMNILRGSLIATRPSPLAATALAVAASPRLGGVAGVKAAGAIPGTARGASALAEKIAPIAVSRASNSEK